MNVGDANNQAAQASAFGSVDFAVQDYRLGKCLLDQWTQGKSEIKTLDLGESQLGSEPTAALVRGQERPGTLDHFAHKEAFALPVSGLNKSLAAANQANDEYLSFTLAVKDYTPGWTVFAKPVKTEFLVTDIRDALQSDRGITSLLETLTVDGDIVNVSVTWKCPTP